MTRLRYPVFLGLGAIALLSGCGGSRMEPAPAPTQAPLACPDIDGSWIPVDPREHEFFTIKQNGCQSLTLTESGRSSFEIILDGEARNLSFVSLSTGKATGSDRYRGTSELRRFEINIFTSDEVVEIRRETEFLVLTETKKQSGKTRSLKLKRGTPPKPKAIELPTH